jgi:CHRD domain/Immunoglobulin domain
MIRSVSRAVRTASLALGLLFAGAAQADIFTRVALLTPTQEVPPSATSTGIGYAKCVIDTNANTLNYRIVYAGLTSAETAAHFHGNAGPGVNAGVIQPLALGTLKTGVWNYPESSEAAILGGQVYINVHTVNFPGGEIRGQLVSAIADLDGGQETPVNGSAGKGFGLFNLDPVAHTLSFYISYGGLGSAETAAHIHGMALPTVAAGVIFPLPAANPKVGVWAYPLANEQQIIDGLTYVNIHTTTFGGGEIRGQIIFGLNVNDPSQEVPPTPTTGSGATLISLDRTANTLGYDIRYRGLSGAETAAHFHGFAPPGVNAGVVFPLALGTPKRGTWNFGAANLNNILNGLSYTNIHTVNFGGGEIRAQVQMPQILLCSPLMTTQPSNATVNSGDPASFTVAADPRGGGALSYQWRHNSVNIPAGAPYSGINTATLSINPATASEAGTYDCVITNTCGSSTSNSATLTVNAGSTCDSPDFDCDGDVGTDADIEAFFACLGGNCPAPPCTNSADFNHDGDIGTDADIEAFFRVLGGGPC